MGTVRINDYDYPLCMTVAAAEAFEERYGTLAKIPTAYTGKTTVGAFREALWQLNELIQGGREYAALVEGKAIPEISLDSLGVLCPISRLGEIQLACMQAINAGLSREVETEPDQKNGSTTQSKKR